jgi:hypothetical protein
VNGTAALVAVGVGIAAFGVGLLAGVTVRRRPDAARARLVEIEHAEVRRLRAQRRAVLDVVDRAQAGEFGMFGLAPVTELRAALGVPRPPLPEFGRGNDTDPATGVIEP